MIVPLGLLIASLAGTGATLAVPGLADYQLLAGCGTLASLFLVWRAWQGRDRATKDSDRNWVVIDGSNVMHWKDGTPRIEAVREVVGRLTKLGYTPGVVFDANAGYLIVGKYQHHQSFGNLLGLPEDRVMVVDKGTPADPTVLLAARDLGARVVSNDRFRDWAETHPEVHEPDHFIRGEYRSGKLWLDLRPAKAEAPRGRKANSAL